MLGASLLVSLLVVVTPERHTQRVHAASPSSPTETSQAPEDGDVSVATLRRTVIGASIGNAVEWFDFAI